MTKPYAILQLRRNVGSGMLRLTDSIFYSFNDQTQLFSSSLWAESEILESYICSRVVIAECVECRRGVQNATVW
jgi:hypothetical protein